MSWLSKWQFQEQLYRLTEGKIQLQRLDAKIELLVLIVPKMQMPENKIPQEKRACKPKHWLLTLLTFVVAQHSCPYVFH